MHKTETAALRCSAMCEMSFVTVRQRDIGWISSIFYVQHLRAQIPKVQKDTEDLTVFFALLGSAHVIAVCKNVDEINPLSEERERERETERDSECV